MASNVYKTNILNKNKLNLKTLSKGNYLSNICVFFKKSITENITFDENPKIIGIEDYDFNLRAIFLYGNAKKFSNNFLGTVTDHSTRSVNIDNIEKAEQRFIFFKNKIFYHKDFHKFNILIKYRVLSTSSLYLALICVKNKNKFKSLKYLYISLVYNFKIITEKRFYYIIFKLIFTFMTKIPITGGSGFLAKNLSLKLSLEKKYRITLCSRNIENLRKASSETKCDYYPLNINSIESLI